MAVKLHVGCGTRHLEGYVNIDIRPEVGPDVVADMGSLHDLYKRGTVQEIYACHVLEHERDPAGMLWNWRAFLEPRGVLRLAVPSMAGVIEAYNAGVHLERLSGLLWGGQGYEGNRHLHGWDYEALACLLRKCGYYDVEGWSPTLDLPCGYDDFSYAAITTRDGREYSVSLNVKAKRS